MPIQARWYDDDHLAIVLEFSPEWTWAEVDEGILSTNQMLRDAPSWVGIITDMRSIRFLPDNTIVYAQRLLLNYNTSSQFANISVVVTSSSFVRMMINVFQRLYGGKPGYPDFYVADTLHQAYALVRAHIMNLQHPGDHG